MPLITGKDKSANVIPDSREIITYKLVRLDYGDDVLYLTDSGTDVDHEGQTYTATAMKIGDISTDSEGKINNVTVTVANVDRAIQYYIEKFELYSKACVVTEVFIAEGEVYSQEYQFRIVSIKTTSNEATFNLGLGFDVLKSRFPSRRAYANKCFWEFKGTECKYSGLHNTCQKTYADCKSKGNVANFGGFRAINSAALWM